MIRVGRWRTCPFAASSVRSLAGPWFSSRPRRGQRGHFRPALWFVLGPPEGSMGSFLFLCDHCLYNAICPIGRPCFPSVPASGQLFIAARPALGGDRARRVSNLGRACPRRPRSRARLTTRRGEASFLRIAVTAKAQGQTPNLIERSLYRFPAGYCTGALSSATPMAGTGCLGSCGGRALVRFCRMLKSAASLHVTEICAVWRWPRPRMTRC